MLDNAPCLNTIWATEIYNSPIVEKNDLSPHSATKTRKKVLTTVLAAARIPAPFPLNSETASSACFRMQSG